MKFFKVSHLIMGIILFSNIISHSVVYADEANFNEEIFSVTIDYSKSFSKLADSYGFHGIASMEHPTYLKDSVTVDLVLLSLDGPVLLSDFLIVTTLLDYRTATVTELLAFWSSFPSVRKKPFMLTFGKNDVPCICWDDNGQNKMSLGGIGSHRNGHDTYFLVARR